MAIALMMRLDGVTFGLPALLDPDEPIFLLLAVKLFREQTLNPGWFGHPGTTTIYAMAIVELLVFLWGYLTGRFPDVGAFADAIWIDPSIVFLPSRLFIVACGVACVGLIYRIGKRLFGPREGLIAAALLAVNPLHIQFSQIIRTDVHATVFMLLCVLCCIDIVRHGRLSAYVLAGICVALACATKWPSATIAVAVAGACLVRIWDNPGETPRQTGYLALGGVAAVMALVVVSPYLVLDYKTVFANVGGESQIQHLGATGGSFLWNASWYLTRPLRTATGIAGVALAAIGLFLCVARHRAAAGTIVAASIVFFAAICAQTLVWSRWIVPLLPFMALFMAVAIGAGFDLLRSRAGRITAIIAAALAIGGVGIPMALAARAGAVERLNDTRSLAGQWMQRNAPPGSTVVLEHLGFELLRERWTLRFPAGRIGCIDAHDALGGKISYDTIDSRRTGIALVDLGTIDPAKIDTCRGDFMILSDLDRYRAEQGRFPRELALYDRLMEGGVLVKTFARVPGQSGGPTVRIIHFPIRM